jgi:hypothetical protein
LLAGLLGRSAVDLDPFTGTMTADVVLMLGTLLLALLVWPVAIASWKGRSQQAAR